jgi:hypothetical protein
VTNSRFEAAGRLAEQRFFDNLTNYNNGNGTPAEVWTYKHDAFGREVEVRQEGPDCGWEWRCRRRADMMQNSGNSRIWSIAPTFCPPPGLGPTQTAHVILPQKLSCFGVMALAPQGGALERGARTHVLTRSKGRSVARVGQIDRMFQESVITSKLHASVGQMCQ